MAKIGEVSKILALKFGLSPSLLALCACVLVEGQVREKDRRSRRRRNRHPHQGRSACEMIGRNEGI